MARAKSTRRKGPRQTSTAGASTTQSLGQAILDCLHAILKRCKEAGVRLDFPGEGGERSFRGWLVTDLITEVLGWPAGKVVVGERFDILLQDADGFPVVTIETKSPYHKASKKERKVFEERLSAYGTLRTAYFTNGAEWVRLDIFAPGGDLEIRDRFTLQLKAASPEEAEGFFAPLFANRHFTETTRSSRHVVRRENPHILEALAADLHQAIGDLAFFFRSLFSGLRAGADRADDMSWLDGAGGYFGKHGSKQQKILRTNQSDLEPLATCEDSLQVQGCIHTCEASP